MKYTYFSQYIDDIDAITRKAREEHDNVATKLETARAHNDATKRDRQASQDKRMIVAAQLREAEAEYKKSVEAIENEASTAFMKLRRSLVKDITEYTAADPSKIDQNAVMLLNSGAMSDADLVALANRFWNSPTMLKLISGKAQKMLDDSRIARLLATKIADFVSSKSRLEVFDTAAHITQRSIHRSGNLMYKERLNDDILPGLRECMAQLDGFHMEAV